MADREQIRRRLLVRLFGNPVTLAPILGGTMAALTPLFFSMDPSVPLFVGITGVVTGLMGLAWNGLVRRDAISQSILDELEDEARTQERVMLDALTKRLERDGDPRTEALLSDLRALVESVATNTEWRKTVNVVAAADILRGIDELFASCVRALERTLELHRMMDTMSTDVARQALVSEREQLIEQVTGSIAQLSRYTSDLRVLGTGSTSSGDDLARIQADLDRSLAAVRKTQAESF